MQFEGIIKNWQFLVSIIVPIIFLPIFFLDEDGTTKFRCAYVILIMAIYWMTDAIPLAVTSLMPIVLFPLFGVQDTDSVSANYMKSSLMMFVGGLIIALAVEYSNLHKRISLKVMMIVGVSPFRLVLGIMMTTMFLSMFISNTATTALMVPIVLALLEQFNPRNYDNRQRDERTENGSVPCDSNSIQTAVSIDDAETINSTVPITDTDNELRMKKYQHGILFAIAYASNIGGAGTMIGCPANLVLVEKAAGIGQNGTYTDLTFVTWMFYNVPPMIVNVIIAWIYLITVFFGFSIRKRENSERMISEENQSSAERLLKEKYRELGPMNFHEGAVAALFFLVVLLWFFRDPKFIPGWTSIFPYPNFKIGDSTSAMLVVLLLFIIPQNPMDVFRSSGTGSVKALLDWKYIQSNLPWGIVLLVGGGFAISSGAEKSGLSVWLGDCLMELMNLSPPLILLIVMIITAAITEFASNTACANIIVPILFQLSKHLNIHPLYLTLPATAACSYGFMLPVAAPSNAIIQAAGNIKTIEMVKTGIVINITCVLVILIFNITYGSVVFDFANYKYPNSTLS